MVSAVSLVRCGHPECLEEYILNQSFESQKLKEFIYSGYDSSATKHYVEVLSGLNANNQLETSLSNFLREDLKELAKKIRKYEKTLKLTEGSDRTFGSTLLRKISLMETMCKNKHFPRTLAEPEILLNELLCLDFSAQFELKKFPKDQLEFLHNFMKDREPYSHANPFTPARSLRAYVEEALRSRAQAATEYEIGWVQPLKWAQSSEYRKLKECIYSDSNSSLIEHYVEVLSDFDDDGKLEVALSGFSKKDLNYLARKIRNYKETLKLTEGSDESFKFTRLLSALLCMEIKCKNGYLPTAYEIAVESKLADPGLVIRALPYDSNEQKLELKKFATVQLEILYNFMKDRDAYRSDKCYLGHGYTGPQILFIQVSDELCSRVIKNTETKEGQKLKEFIYSDYDSSAKKHYVELLSSLNKYQLNVLLSNFSQKDLKALVNKINEHGETLKLTERSGLVIDLILMQFGRE